MSTIEDIQRIGVLLIEANGGKPPKDRETNHLIQMVEENLGNHCWEELIEMYTLQKRRSVE